ncbi:MAG: acetoin utilization protein AcuC [Chloroflexi bacterium]|nr:acetoin utilization protein AcuC [Chloroflexota bacterium]
MEEETLHSEVKKLALVWGPALFNYDFGSEHPFSAVRALQAHTLMEAVGLLKQPEVTVLPSVYASREDLLLFHTRELVEFVQNACVRGHGFLDEGDTPALEGGMEAAEAVVGSSWSVTEMVAKGEARTGMVLVGGLHHAHPGRVSGFCIFNDLAINIVKLRQNFGFQRIAYIDIDAHHGDGVVYGFYEDPNVLAIDFHEDGRYLFPGTGDLNEMGRGAGNGFTFNLALPPYSSDQSFIYAFDELVPPLLRRFKPDFIMLVTGVDAHGGDPLSDMNFSSVSYTHATRTLRTLAEELCDGRLVAYGAGGYNVATCALRWTEVAATLCDYALPEYIPQAWREQFTRTIKEDAPITFSENRTSDNTLPRVEKMVDWFKMKAKL